jgi:hypothetical protein
LALAVGILVDDSTVTIENTHRLLSEEGMPLPEATLHGAAGIAVPTLVSTLAISCVFELDPIRGTTGHLDLRCNRACPYPSRIKLLVVLCCGYVGNAFALSKRSGISTALAAASILFIPSRHTAIGIWLFIAW